MVEQEKKTSQPRGVDAKPLGANEGNWEVCVRSQARPTPAQSLSVLFASEHWLRVLQGQNEVSETQPSSDCPPPLCLSSLLSPGAEFFLPLCLQPAHGG